MDEKEARRPLTQFTIKRLLLLVLVAAIGIVVWQRYIYVHPAHKNSSYEKAPYTKSGQARIGPNQIAIASISRSDRDGSLVVQDQRGNGINKTVRNTKALKSSGSWLDTAQLELEIGPGDVEILELRVFDFETRSRITEDNRFGYRVVDKNTIHLYGLGAKLPDRLDVWLRVASYEPNQKIVKLAPQESASCNLLGGKVTVSKAVEGYTKYSSRTGLVGGGERDDFALLLEYDGPPWPDDTRYHFTTVLKDGTRILSDYFMRFPAPFDGGRCLFHDIVSLSEVDYFELRPSGHRQPFFFEGVQLPKTSQAKFKKPPDVSFAVGGEERAVEVVELAPLSMKLSSHRGHYATGMRSSGSLLRLEVNPKREETNDRDSTIAFYCEGLSSVHWDETLLDKSGMRLTLSQRDGGSAGGAGSIVGYSTIDQPLENVDKVRLKFR